MNLPDPAFHPLIILLAGILLEFLLARLLSARAKGILALAVSALASLTVFLLMVRTSGGSPWEASAGWSDGPFTLAYHIDGLSGLFALMAGVIGSLVLLYSIPYMQHERGTTRFYCLMLFFIAGLIHLVFSADLLMVYIGWEVIGICSFLLVGFWYDNAQAVHGARRVLIFTHLAGYGLLAAILLLYQRSGATLWTDPRIQEAFSLGVFLLMLVAIAAKSVQFPLHVWIPDAMNAPTPVSALLHSACYVKSGVYLLVRLYHFGSWSPLEGQIVVWLGVITLTVGALYAMIQTDLKRLLAFSTVSQIGYMLMGIGMGTPLGIAAGLLHTLNHGFFKGGLFLCAGSLQHACGTRDMNRMGGLHLRMPRTTAFWLIQAGSIAGIPLLSGFVSKWLLFNAGLQSGNFLPVMIAWYISLVTIFYFLKATAVVFYGPPAPGQPAVHESPAGMRWGMGLMAGVTVLFGILPQLPIRFLINPILTDLGLQPLEGMTWLGFQLSTGRWETSTSLVLALIGALLAAGIGIALQKRRPSAQADTGIFSGGEAITPSTTRASDFSATVQQNLEWVYRWLDADRAYAALWNGLKSVSALFERFSRWLEARMNLALPLILVLALAVLLLVSPFTANTSAHANSALPPLWLLAFGTCGLIFTLISSLRAPTRPLAPFLLSSTVLVLAGMLSQAEIIRLIALEGASLVIALYLVFYLHTSRLRWTYLLVTLLSSLCLFAAQLSLPAGFVASLFTAGLLLKLALIPFSIWLAALGSAAPVLALGLIVAVLDMSAFAELVLFGQSSAFSAAPGFWLGLGALSALGAALLMLVQTDLKRFLVFSSIEDLGYLSACLAMSGELAPQAILLGVFTHIAAKTLLFCSLAAPEAAGLLKNNSRGWQRAFPFSGFAFLLGMFAMLGIPLLCGFSARWRLYFSFLQVSPWLLGVFLLASALTLLAYVRMLTRFWWGEPAGLGEVGRRGEAWLSTALLLLLVLVLIGVGLFPQAAQGIAALAGGMP